VAKFNRCKNVPLPDTVALNSDLSYKPKRIVEANFKYNASSTVNLIWNNSVIFQ